MNFKRNIIIFVGCLLLAFATKAQTVQGDWKGTLEVQGMKMELVFHIKASGGTYTSTLDVPAQGAVGLPVEKTELNGTTLSLKAPALKIAYTGEQKGNSIEGKFEQGGMSFPLVLTKFESKLPGDNSLPSTVDGLSKLAAYDNGNQKYAVLIDEKNAPIIGQVCMD